MDLGSLCSLPPQERFHALASSPAGLSDEEAGRRQREHGRNEVAPPEARSRSRALLAELTHPLALLLWFGAVMAFAARAPELALAIVAVIAINGVFAFLQQQRAAKVVEALLARAALTARVRRGGTERLVPASELVPGDVVLLAAGSVVPADCVLVSADALSLDLSLLTGETTPVLRGSDASHEATVARAELPCLAPAAAGVLTGSADALVAATGAESTLGEVATLLQQARRTGSLIEREVAELSRLTAVLAVLCGVATLALAISLRGIDIITALTFGTGVIVALVPEGLLPLLTVSLAMGARRMAHRGALVRTLTAVEVVGSSTVICTDKTGTLTQNTVAVRGLIPWPGARDAEHRARLVAALCNDAASDEEGSGDPIDRGLVRWLAHEQVDVTALRSAHPRSTHEPFDPHRRYMRTECSFADGDHQLMKGAPEAVLSQLGTELPAEVGDAIAAAARRGERLLLVAEGRVGAPPECVGILPLHDPPRPEVPAAVAACRRAGIRIVMITGDHPATARGIGILIGLADERTHVLEGAQLDELGDHQLLEHLRGEAILARVTPEQKLRVVRVLQASGEVITVTGDGVNDAPALRRADVGIAMGHRGTEVAKQASDIVLLDENFATIVAAIEEGRAIKQNIRKFVSYVFTSNVAELVPFIAYVFLPVPLPLTILQVLAIELGTDLLPALALGLEPPSAHTLAQPPEPPKRPLLTRALATRTFLFYGAIEATLGMVAFFAVFWFHGWRPFASLAPFDHLRSEAATLTFLGIVGGQVGCLFAQRDGSLRARLTLATNPWIALGLGFELALALSLVYVPGVRTLFSMTAVAPGWLIVLPLGGVVMVAADHLRRTRTGARAPQAPSSGAAIRAAPHPLARTWTVKAAGVAR